MEHLGGKRLERRGSNQMEVGTMDVSGTWTSLCTCALVCVEHLCLAADPPQSSSGMGMMKPVTMNGRPCLLILASNVTMT